MSTKASCITVCLSILLLLSAMQAGALPPLEDRPAADLADRAYWTSELVGSEAAIPMYQSILTDYRDYIDTPSIKARLQQMYLRRGRYDDVIALADSVIAEYPNSGVALWSEFFKGVAYRRKGDIESASEQFSKVFENIELADLGPILAACNEQGKIFARIAYGKLDHPEESAPPTPTSTPEREAAAKAIYDKAMAVLNSQIHINKDPMGKNRQALQDLEGLVANYYDTSYVPNAMRAIVNAHLNLRQNEEAIAAAWRVIAGFPGTTQAAWSQLFIGEAYRNMHQFLNAYYAFREVEAYASLPDVGPVYAARRKAKEMWGDLCDLYPDMKAADWPVIDLTILDLALLNGYDRDDPVACAWVGTCWITAKKPELALSLYDEMSARYPEQRFFLGIAAVVAGERYYYWAKCIPNPKEREVHKAAAVRLLESVRMIVPDIPYIQSYADLMLVRIYSLRKKKWPEIIAAAEHGLSAMPGPYLEELADSLGEAYLCTGQYAKAAGAYSLVTRKANYSGWMLPAICGSANAMAGQGRLAEAAQQFLNAATVGNAPDWRMLAAEEAANCRLLLGDKAGAAEALRLAAQELRADMASGRPHLQAIWPAYAAKRLSIIESRILALEGNR